MFLISFVMDVLIAKVSNRWYSNRAQASIIPLVFSLMFPLHPYYALDIYSIKRIAQRIITCVT